MQGFGQQHINFERRAACNSTFAIGGVSFSADSFVVTESSVPIDKAPLGWEVETRSRETKITKFEHAYPKIFLPFQEVQRVAFILLV